MQNTEQSIDPSFAFVQKLASDLSKGNIELPSFPDIVIKVREALDDEDCTTAQLVQIIGAEPVLAAKLLSIANSAALKPSGDEITDLNMAVNRIGLSLVRSTAMSFALAQMNSNRKLNSVKKQLGELWERCAHVAALCYVLAKGYTRLSADEALFVGLMHGIGDMYILVQADEQPDLIGGLVDFDEIMNKWGASIGGAILENWQFNNHVIEAVRSFRNIEREHDGGTDYTDVLIVARLLYEFTTSTEDTELLLGDIPACRNIDLAAPELIGILQQSKEQIRSLRHALGK